MADIGNAAERIAPGAPGSTLSFVFTSGDSGVQSLGALAAKNQARYISIKTTALMHVCFGPAAALVPAITNADAPFDTTDGWQDVLLKPGWDSYKIKGDTTGGTLSIWPSGN